MAKKHEIYKCEKEGLVVEVLEDGACDLVCCGEPMTLLEEQTADAANEKHVPLIEKIDGGYKVTVGSTIHPMTDEHWIQWIELIADGVSYRKFLTPNDEPVAEFMVEASTVSAREHCNVHGLWKG